MAVSSFSMLNLVACAAAWMHTYIRQLSQANHFHYIYTRFYISFYYKIVDKPTFVSKLARIRVCAYRHQVSQFQKSPASKRNKSITNSKEM